MSTSDPQRAASLLSLIASKALTPSGFADDASASTSARERSDAELEQHRAQTMMYAARMKYLQDNDAVMPDTMFMTRKQAQKLARQDSVAAMSLRKIDVGGKSSGNAGNGGVGASGDTSKGGGANAAANGLSPNWKKQRGLLQLDDRQQTWVPVTQAGCHFWQSRETGECRAVAPGEWEGCPHPDLPRPCDDDGDDADDPPFPESFAFLKSK